LASQLGIEINAGRICEGSHLRSCNFALPYSIEKLIASQIMRLVERLAAEHSAAKTNNGRIGELAATVAAGQPWDLGQPAPIARCSWLPGAESIP